MPKSNILSSHYQSAKKLPPNPHFVFQTSSNPDERSGRSGNYGASQASTVFPTALAASALAGVAFTICPWGIKKASHRPVGEPSG